MNKMFISGFVARDAETRITQSGKGVCKFSVAFRKNNDVTDWLEVTAWDNAPCYGMAQLVSKGHIVVVSGEPRVEQYTNKNGEEVKKNCITAEIIMIQQFLPTQQQDSVPQPPTQHKNFENNVNMDDFQALGDGGLPF